MEIIKLMKRKELVLNTKGTCFLCQQRQPDPGTSEEEVKKEVCLRSLCRFLNVSSSSVLRRGLGEGESGGDNEVQCDFSATLCQECENVVEKLAALMRQQEVVKMKIMDEVQVLSNILREPEGGVQEEGLRDQGNSSLSSRLVTLLRQETRVKCVEKLKNEQLESVPKVKVRRLTPQNLSRVKDPPLQSVEPEPEIPVGLEQQNSEEESATAWGGESASELLQKVVSTQCRKIDPAGPGETCRFQCAFCSNLLSARKIKLHLTTLHPEQFLGSAKRPNVSESQFYAYCRQLLTMETEKARQQPLCSGAAPRSTSCLFCGKTCSTAYHLRAHLVSMHSTVLEAELMKLQDEKDLLSPELINVENSSPAEPGRRMAKKSRKVVSSKKVKTIQKQIVSLSSNRQVWICSVAEGGCGKRLASARSLKVHQKQACSKDSTKWACKDLLEQKLFGESALESNEIRNCPNREHLLKTAVTGKQRRKLQVGRASPRRTCEECGGRRFGSKAQFEKHMKQVHGGANQGRGGDNKDRVVILESIDIPVTAPSGSPSPNGVAKLEQSDVVNWDRRVSPREDDITIPRLQSEMTALSDEDREPEGLNPEKGNDINGTCWCGLAYESEPMIKCNICRARNHMSCEEVEVSSNLEFYRCSACS